MTIESRAFTCRRCNRTAAHGASKARDGILSAGGRRLCTACTRRCQSDGTIIDYPRVTRTREEFVEEYRILKERGLSIAEMAEKMGLSVDAVYINRVRARRAGVDI